MTKRRSALLSSGVTFASIAEALESVEDTPGAPEQEDEVERMVHLLAQSGSEEEPRPSQPLPGLASFPRLRRTLHFPEEAPPSTPAVDSTLTSPPLPPVPPSVLADPAVAGTIDRAPHLFKISSPFRLPALRALLLAHPNRPLIDSVLQGFETGFWPGHSGDFSSFDSSASLPSLSDDDHEFIATQLHKDFEAGYLSEPFDELLPGMVVSPMFVVRLEGRKPRAVVDQTASGLNAGVSKEVARVTYDTIAELGRLMRYRRRRGEAGEQALLWKSDVSGAFRTLPVALQWQVRQVHRSRVWDPRERRFRFVYYVDRRLVFGGRFSPRLWCTIMNVVMWGVKSHLGLEFPLEYVDDAFNLDCSGILLPVTHPVTGEERLVPRDQARLLLIWNFVGVPWSWDKQLHGVRLIILGHLVDALAFTVELPPDAKAAFIETIKNFLDDPTPALVRWQRLAGYAQWACSVIPLARFALNPVYDKIRGKFLRDRGIRVNKAVRTALSWLAAEVEEAPPLDLLDPSLEDWADRSADLVMYSDACLVSKNGLGSGLGFWYRKKGDLHRSAFYSRINPPLTDIFYAEALAVSAAIQHAIDDKLAPRRLLVFTDSALTVYAYDTGRVKGDVLPLVQGSYEALRKAGIDLRVRHVSGEINSTADKLSRLPPSLLLRGFPSLSSFTVTPSNTPSREGEQR